SRLGLAELPRVTVDVPANSELMQISVENRSPTVAADAANALAELLIGNVRQLDITAASTTREALDRQLARLRDELDQSRAAPSDSSPPGSAKPAPADLLQQEYARVADRDARARLAEVVPQGSLYVLEPATI